MNSHCEYNTISWRCYVYDANPYTIKRFWALCLDTHMKLALYKYAIIIIIIIIIITRKYGFPIEMGNWSWNQRYIKD